MGHMDEKAVRILDIAAWVGRASDGDRARIGSGFWEIAPRARPVFPAGPWGATTPRGDMARNRAGEAIANPPSLRGVTARNAESMATQRR